jgi:hypothetical protein
LDGWLNEEPVAFLNHSTILIEGKEGLWQVGFERRFKGVSEVFERLRKADQV